MAQQTALSVMALPGVVHSFVAKTPPAAVVFVLFGDVFLFTAANYVAALDFHFEAWHRATSGTSHARLFDITLSSPVGGSTVTTTSGTLIRQRSGALTLTDGSEYRLQLGSQAGDAGAALGGKVISFA